MCEENITTILYVEAKENSVMGDYGKYEIEDNCILFIVPLLTDITLNILSEGLS